MGERSRPARPLGGVVEKAERKTKEPSLYRVILHNDDYTTMDFVVEILTTIFRLPQAEAVRVMLDVHRRGRGVCGTYPYDIATTKVAKVMQRAREHEFPLKATVEPA